MIMADEELDYGALTTLADGETQAVRVRGSRTYRGDEYYITVVLSELKGSRIIEDEDPYTGQPVRGLFVPFAESGVTVTPTKKVQTTFKANVAQVPSNKYSHVLTQIVDKEVEMERKRLGVKTTLCGHMRPAYFKKKTIK